MITELIVTSAPRGLQAGRSGFTTVMRTRGIHPDLAARLEAASGYRHTHPQGDPRNPVIFNYTNIHSAAGDGWVLSRIGDAGTDYTGRSNKIAHHISIKPEDVGRLTSSNPAVVLAALAETGGFKTVWGGDPSESLAAPTLPMPPSQPGVCELWRAAAGDPGWAGVLVERALSKETTWIVAPPGTNILGLFAEALALAGPSQRWQIPFTTYSLNRNEGRWLGTVQGTPEADAARSQPRTLVIDLTKPGIPTMAGPYVQAARGLAPPPWAKVHTPLERAALPLQSPAAALSRATFEAPAESFAHLEAMPPPMQVRAIVPPALKQWPGSLPEPLRPWYATPLVYCAAGAGVLSLTALVAAWSLLGRQADPTPTKESVVKAQVTPPTQMPPPADTVAIPDPTGASLTADVLPVENNLGPGGQQNAEGGEKTTSIDKPYGLVIGGNVGTNPPPEPHRTVFDLLVDAVATNKNTTIRSLPLNEKELQWGEHITLVQLKAFGRMDPVELWIPALEGPDAPQFRLEQMKSSLDATSPAEAVWTFTRSDNTSRDIGSIVVSATSVIFTIGKDYASAGRTLPLRSLVFHDKATGKSAWIRLHPPFKQELYASVDSAQPLTNLFHADKNDGKALSNALRISDITLQFPQDIEGQCLHEDPADPFTDKLTWPSDQSDLRFRWRPSSWDRNAGAWITGQLTLSHEWRDGFVQMKAALALGSPSCIPTGLDAELMDNNAFSKSLTTNKPIQAEKFSSVLHFAALSQVDPQYGAESPAPSVKRNQLVNKKIDDGWEDLDLQIERADPSVCEEIGIPYRSFASMRKGKQAKPAAEWVDYLRWYLLAWRVGGESSHIPDKPPAKAPEKEDEKAAHLVKDKNWRDAVEKLRRELRPTDKAAFHRWCEEIMMEKGDSPQKDLAKLWVLLSTFAEDQRKGLQANVLRRTMRPRVSGLLSFAWQKHPEGMSVTAMELISGPGRTLNGSDGEGTEGPTAEVVTPSPGEVKKSAGEAAAEAGGAAVGVKHAEPSAAPTGEPDGRHGLRK
jgi:hypothetical protein